TGTKFGRTFLEVRGLRKAWAGRAVVRGLDLDLGPGDRIGVVGANGAGKSTLLGMLAGTIAPDGGTLSRGPRVRIAVLDQERTGLPLDTTVFEAAGDGNDQVVVGDHPIHVASFLRRFLFPREALDQQVQALSGGERARLLLARLMLQGSHLLLLDEPTNDLDLMTLRVLEEALLGFDGAAVIVTHDRAFLDRVCTAVLAFHDDGRMVRYASRQQWLEALDAESRPAAAATAPHVARTAPSQRLSYKEQQELAGLPARIEELEAQRGALAERLAAPETYRSGQAAQVSAQIDALGAQIDAAWARWESLEARR
ncbi:MAG TPA: ATP-binding cassette domain-containing protein, partial [Myxococcota bacterium]|nr:ATP-binding cassette domain-containing protein [Myxococcota bacterium]